MMLYGWEACRGAAAEAWREGARLSRSQFAQTKNQSLVWGKSKWERETAGVGCPKHSDDRQQCPGGDAD